MILDEEIEEMGRLFLDARIEVLTAKGLMDGAEEGCQTFPALPPEQSGGFTLSRVPDSLSTLMRPRYGTGCLAWN